MCCEGVHCSSDQETVRRGVYNLQIKREKKIELQVCYKKYVHSHENSMIVHNIHISVTHVVSRVALIGYSTVHNIHHKVTFKYCIHIAMYQYSSQHS